MRKISLIGLVMLIVSIPTFAGGLLTNTNQHVAFLRMLARGASIDIDGVYSNPAGLAFLPGDGLYLSLNGQSAYQTRNIDMTFPLFPEDGNRRYYKGKASAPFVPSFQGAYKKGDWTISGSFAVVGGGGKASFDDGLGMFDAMIMSKIYGATQGSINPGMYSINSAMDGSQFIYGVQLGLSYKVTDWLSVFAGGRMNYFSGGYEGFLTATVNPDIPQLGGTELASMKLDCDQTGWGLTPILGADVKLGKWNIGLKYEFMTNLNLENKTKVAEVLQNGEAMGEEGNPLADYKDGVNTPSDIPALLTAAVGYEILPSLRASVEYHHFFDKAAGMANDKQKALKHGTHEVLVGAEWDITKRLTISGGYQNTDYGLADDFQSDISFSCDSYSLGFGAAVKMTEHLTMNIAYFWTNYKDYNKASETALGVSATTYSRTNKVFGLGVDYKF
ncbi:OmpP1/FadL family transporter [uncultured Bacteroides sp.]|uniref:OmpP1/FadL family transporter n=1 Tax=uncultured Bacteroides sp. TaxID=162156 RepID=UPI002675DB50|nr:hypothetical protein [uncultured Bacteroides sp.]